MSSTNKTGLGFNQWILADKPTMEDFNADNVLVEQLLEERYTKGETDERFAPVSACVSESDRANWDGKLDKTGGTVTGPVNFTGNLTRGGEPVATYKAGTWQPTSTAFNLTPRYAFYVRVGQLVTVNSAIDITAISGNTDYAIINGLPFSAASHGPFGISIAAFPSISLQNVTQIIGRITSTGINLFAWTPSSQAGLRGRDFESGVIEFSATYIA